MLIGRAVRGEHVAFFGIPYDSTASIRSRRTPHIPMHSSDRRRHLRLLHVSWVLTCLLFRPPAALAQTWGLSSPYQTAPELASTLCAGTIADLPLADNVYTLLETTQPEVISDRFNAGGLNVGENARLGAFLSSWSQTAYRIGDIDITDPSGSGAPLLFPQLQPWDCVNVVTGLMPADFNPPGLGITLFPKPVDLRQADRPLRTSIDGFISGGGLASPTPDGLAPPISRLNAFGRASLVTTGALIPNRLNLAAGGSWQRASKFLREVSPAATSDVASGFAHLVYTPGSSTSRTLVWVQRTNVPFAYRALFSPDAATRDRAIHVQTGLDRQLTSGLRWQFNGGFTDRSRANDLQGVSAITADRLVDGPIPAIAAATGAQSAGRWMLSGRVQPKRGSRHITEIAASIDHAFLRSSDQFDGTIGEFVDTTRARRWTFAHPDQESRRHATTVAAFATDQITIKPGMTIDTGVRFESVTGQADGAASDIVWRSVLPRAVLRWAFGRDGKKVFVGGYRRSANRLNLDLLAFGDPNAQTAIVTRFLPAPLAAAAIIDRVGPGTGGNPSFSSVSSDLERPYTDEFVISIQPRPLGRLDFGLTGIARREANTIAVEDVGVPITSYSTIGIPDPGHDFVSAEDDQILTAYNRLPESYGRNRFVVVNAPDQPATMFALKLWATGEVGHLWTLFGATASMANGSAANRGYGPLENDQDVTGELLTDPNATTFARGRLFSDRAFTIKWSAIYSFPKDIHVGVIARYQDGQPFARLVKAADLNQGAELIRAYPNAGNRFTFTGTLDIRVRKSFAIGKQHLDGMLDFYNLATRGNEVEEYTVTGPNFRTPTAIEPPRSVQLGVQLTF